ncbi:hypothetical protein Hanom_Chr12g01101121 [Helianthus anomalus]
MKPMLFSFFFLELMDPNCNSARTLNLYRNLGIIVGMKSLEYYFVRLCRTFHQFIPTINLCGIITNLK